MPEVKIGQEIIALKISQGEGIEPLFLGNSSILPLVGRRVSFGNESPNRSVTEIQQKLSLFITMLPFTVFSQAGLDLFQVKIRDKGLEESVTRKIEKYDTKKNENYFVDEVVHFTGASLFDVSGKLFLFDIDRRELEHKVFNPFLVELGESSVKTIEEAYQSLKPKEVIEAEKLNLKILRQGEWFFIPVKESFEPTKGNLQWRTDDEGNMRFELRAGENRPNYATKGFRQSDNQVFVSGTVTHSGREHEALILKGWFKAVPNTSIQSWQITGDID